MSEINGITSGLSSITNGYDITKSDKLKNDVTDFQKLIDSTQRTANNVNKSTLSTSSVNNSGRINGDYTTGFDNTFTSKSDKTSKPTGFAANSSSPLNKNVTIDKTSKLYEKSMEMENYLVKMMLSSMRKTLSGTDINGEDKSYAQSMYEDMLYDQMSTDMTKQAGLGIADQIYLELA
jgi:flagellar protein FlgJ